MYVRAALPRVKELLRKANPVVEIVRAAAHLPRRIQVLRHLHLVLMCITAAIFQRSLTTGLRHRQDDSGRGDGVGESRFPET